MKGVLKELPRIFSRFRIPKSIILFTLFILLAAAALAEFFVTGLARRTFVFYAVDNGAMTVEDRMLRVSRGNARAASREIDITRYVEEALLGPISPDALPLFPRETRLVSLLYRDDVVYADFSEEAALPPAEGGDVIKNIKTLYAGVRRNFPFVKDIRFFIEGKAAWTDEFRQNGDPDDEVVFIDFTKLSPDIHVSTSPNDEDDTPNHPPLRDDFPANWPGTEEQKQAMRERLSTVNWDEMLRPESLDPDDTEGRLKSVR